MSLSTISTLSSMIKINKVLVTAPNTLLWHYKFDTVTSSYIQNYVTSANTVFINGTSQYLDSTTNNFKVGTKSLKLNNTYVSIGESFTVDNTGLAFAFWFKTSTTGAYSRVFSFESGVKTHTINFLITNNNKIGLSIFDGSTFYDYFDTYNYTVNDGVWRHIVWTILPDRTNTIYINGTSAYSFTSAVYPASVTRNMNSFGNNDFGNSLYTGWIDDFRLYSGILSQADITAIYNTTT
jgi:hypothetical protein